MVLLGAVGLYRLHVFCRTQEVRKLSTAEKEGRVSAMDRLRNLGDFNHNIDVLLSGSGTLVAGRMINLSNSSLGLPPTTTELKPCVLAQAPQSS